MKKCVMILFAMALGVSNVSASANQFVQKDGLYQLTLPDGWRAEAWGKSRDVILPPAPRQDGIVIGYKPYRASVTSDQIKDAISADLSKITETDIKPAGGSVIENKEVTIDNIDGRYLLYSVTLKGQNMTWIRYEFAEKGYIFSIDYGNPDRSAVDQVMDLVNTIKF